jgi:hypothetical protein
MFIGHFALAFAAKRAAPVVSLGTLFLACQFADLLWPNLVLAGVEHLAIAPGITAVTPLDFQSYPYSHSLLALGIWAGLAAVLYKVIRGATPLAAVCVVAGLVLSHWVLDVISHRPDVPLTIGSDMKLGLGLWNSRPATIAVELAMLAAGLAMYIRSTKPIDRVGKFALAGLVVFLLAINVANMYGPPPPSATAVAWSVQAVWLLVAWGYWIDRHRRPRKS